jgi:hypothetical protein
MDMIILKRSKGFVIKVKSVAPMISNPIQTVMILVTKAIEK